MLAVGMIKGKKGVFDFEIPKPVITRPDEVLVRVKEVGLDGTDFNIARYNLQDIAEGRSEMVMGHEMSGVVEEVGKAVKNLSPGDPVVVTVRRGGGVCQPCLHNQSDMCLTGLFTEHGIHKLDGFLTQYTVAEEQYVVKVPQELTRLAVLAEPVSIAEKGIEQIKHIQSRIHWYCGHSEHSWDSEQWGGCKVALVVGAGPLGLLATALLRLAGVTTYTSDLLPESHPRIKLLADTQTHYIDARKKTPKEVVQLCCTAGSLDIIFEAAGAATTAVALIPYMSRSSIYVMTGIPREELRIELDAAKLVHHIVSYNQVVVGSVNSNRKHVEKALEHMPVINERCDGLLDKMITHRFPLSDYKKAFATAGTAAIKTVIEVEPWD
jgi:threonine dehydrogenase-like Zn-dependent dehydrogenase